MEAQFCPFCNQELEMEHKILYIDFHCTKHREHYFGKRLRQNDKSLDCVKIRLSEPDEERLYIKIYFQEGYLEVWKHSSKTKRYRINHTFVPDYSKPELLKNKIKAYIAFC